MIINYLTIIIRNLARNKSFFAINAIGLAIGLSALKGKGNSNLGAPGSIDLKNILVTIQLVISIILISSALITRGQFEYLVEKKLGLEKDQVYAITNVPDLVKDQYGIFKKELEKISGVDGVSAVMEVPSREIRDTGFIYAEGKQEDSANAPRMDIQVVDLDFFEVMQVDILAGAAFTANLNPPYEPMHGESVENIVKYIEAQNRTYLLNETAVKTIGWQQPQEAIGKQFSWGNGFVNYPRGKIVGVVKDFHQESLRNRIDPMVLVYEPIWFRNFLIRLNTEHVSTTIGRIEEAWGRLYPNFPMESYFLDDLYNRLYQGENRQLRMLYLFSGLAIVIAFLGIFGLFSYILNIRIKEIAIRRVLGATVQAITVLLGKGYILVTALGILMAVPLTWYLMSLWLDGFVYRITISG